MTSKQNNTIDFSRMAMMCEQLVGDLGEDEIYEAFSENPGQLSKYLCKGEGTRGSCAMKPKRRKLQESDEL